MKIPRKVVIAGVASVLVAGMAGASAASLGAFTGNSLGSGDDVVASWNGPDQGTARFSLDVDGYPRAFNFAVDCSSATDRQPQGPQYDWRQIHILAPTARTTLLKAPAAVVPMHTDSDSRPSISTSTTSPRWANAGRMAAPRTAPTNGFRPFASCTMRMALDMSAA